MQPSDIMMAVGAPGLSRGTVVDVGSELSVAFEGGEGESPVLCDVLAAGEEVPSLLPGDPVLVWRGVEGGRGVVLGRIRAAGAPVRGRPAAREEDAPGACPAGAGDDGEGGADGDGEIPETLVLEARKSLTLKVGEGTIVLREDGKILLRGRDLVSRATRMNRIKGGAVAIN